MARGMLVPQPGMEPTPPAMEVKSPNHWTARKALKTYILNERMMLLNINVSLSFFFFSLGILGFYFVS